MIEAGWTSKAIERYAWHRYGEEIPDSTIRTYKAKHGIERKTPTMFTSVDPDEVIDTLGMRQELIRLQASRIQIDTAHETNMRKLFSSSRAEIALLNSLLSDHKADLQDLGLFPRLGMEMTVHGGVPAEAPDLPKARTLGEALGNPAASPEQQAAMGRLLHLATSNGHSNGHAQAAGE